MTKGKSSKGNKNVKTFGSKSNIFSQNNSRTTNFMNGKSLTKPFKNK